MDVSLNNVWHELGVSSDSEKFAPQVKGLDKKR